MNCILDEIFSSKMVTDKLGNAYKLNAGISKSEGDFIRRLITNEEIDCTIEIGCNFGLSTLFICDALSKKESPRHVIIDPHQSTHAHGIGINNIERAGYGFYELIEKPSEIALPNLLEKGEKFNFALIDGWHTFDHTLLDFFYLNRLLEIGGIIVFDDCTMPSVNRVVRYISNYESYSFLGSVPHSLTKKRKTLNVMKFIMHNLFKLFPTLYTQEIFDDSIIRAASPYMSGSSMIALRKIAPDNRSYKWYKHF